MFRNPRKDAAKHAAKDAASTPRAGREAGPDRQRILLDALADLSSTLDRDEVLDRILARSLELSEAERALLLLGDAGSAGLTASKALGAGGEALLPEEVVFSTTVVKRALEEGRPVTEELTSDSQMLAASQSIFDLRLQSVMCAPLRIRDDTVGAIYLDSRVQRKTFTAADRELLEALARQAAIAIQNARLLVEAEERARLSAEIELAAEVQDDLLPETAPHVGGLDVAGRCVACAELSGDFYDFIPLPGGRLALWVADVAGHGVGPALLAAEARGEIRALMPIDSDPGAILTRVHRNLRETLDPERFLTLFLAVVDPASGLLRYASAGHPEALLYQSGETGFLVRTGPPLGVDVDAVHESRSVEGLRGGDGLLVYSDGLVEARRADGEVFGAERLAGSAMAAKGGAAGMIEQLLGAVAEFSGGVQDDDLTAVVVLWT